MARQRLPREQAEAIDAVQGISALIEPVRAMEQALGRELPDAGAFLDEWIARLEASAPTDGDWESDQERWLRWHVCATVIDALDRPPRSPLEPTLEPGDPSTRLSTPTTLAVLDRAEVRSRLCIVSIWTIRRGEQEPRLVTLYPEGSRWISSRSSASLSPTTSPSTASRRGISGPSSRYTSRMAWRSSS